MNDILFANIKRARIEVEKEVISENMMGIDFSTLIHECESTIHLVRISVGFEQHEMQFKKGEW